jgi:hypothetical protein
MRYWALSIGLILTLFSACATSPPNSTNSSSSDHYAVWNVNASGFITLGDFNHQVCATFASLDADQDGYLEPSEFAKSPQWISSVKRMPDGRVSIVAYVAAADQAFQREAHTHPGRLTKAEFDSLQKAK